MKYRKFGKLDFNVSVLSLHLRRKIKNSDQDTIKLVQYAIDHGVNHLVIGYPHNPTEYKNLLKVVGVALQGNYREKVRISLPLPISIAKSRHDLNSYIDECINLLALDGVDFCLIDEVNRENLEIMKKLDIINWLERFIDSGKISGTGFSFHDDYRFLRDAIEAYSQWLFCQFKYSFMDATHHPGVVGIKYAAEKGLAVVITEPFKCGRLLKKQPEDVKKIFEGLLTKSPVVEWCLQWVWDHSEVSTVAVEVDSLEQLIENLSAAEKAEPERLNIQELKTIDEIRDTYNKMKPINCAVCACCMPCPVGINVPQIFEIYNDAVIYDDFETARFCYKVQGHDAGKCIECGKCVDRCPRKIPITDWLKIILRRLQVE